MNTPEKLSELTADLREQIARVIDPEAWGRPPKTEGVFDHRGRLVGARFAEPFTPANNPLTPSLEKADAILALINPRAETAEAALKVARHDRERMREALYALECAARHGGVKRGDPAQIEARAILSALQLPPEGEEFSSVGMALASPTPPSPSRGTGDCEPSSVGVSAPPFGLCDEDFETIAAELTSGVQRYRVVQGPDGYEPQMLHTLGMKRACAWFPLTEGGYWAEPSGFTDGTLTQRSFLASKEEADRAIVCARRVNGERLIAAAPEESK